MELSAVARYTTKSFTHVEKHGTMVCRDKVQCGSVQLEAEVAVALTA